MPKMSSKKMKKSAVVMGASDLTKAKSASSAFKRMGKK